MSRIRLVVAALLGLQAVLLIRSAQIHSVAIDESAHIATGVHNWRTGDYSLYPVNPPVSRLVQTLPLLTPDVRSSVPGRLSWRRPGDRIEGIAAKEFAANNADRYPDLVVRARWCGPLWSALGGWLIFLWASKLYGPRAGLLGVVLWVFEPYLLGHGALATPDVPATAAGLLAGYAFWSYAQKPSWPGALLAGVALGLAVATKFTLLVLIPFWPLAVVVSRGQGTNAPRRSKSALHLAIGLIVPLVLVNVVYECNGTGTPLGQVPLVSHHLGVPVDSAPPPNDRPPNRFHGTMAGLLPLPLPVDLVQGFDLQRRDFEHMGRPSYLRGEWKATGWPHYYLYAWAVKLPIGTLTLILLGLALSVAAFRREWRNQVLVLAPGLAILVVVSSQSGFSHHSRYTLPALPFFLVAAARAGACVRPDSWRRGALVVGCAGATAVSSLAVYPHSLSYFNELAGGPANGGRHLLDSNLDWGQDLALFRRWMDDHPEAAGLRYEVFSFIDPKYYGVPAGDPPPDEPQPGWYAVSVNAVHGMRLYRNRPDQYTYFRRFQPIDRIGYTILIFHLTEADLAASNRP